MELKPSQIWYVANSFVNSEIDLARLYIRNLTHLVSADVKAGVESLPGLGHDGLGEVVGAERVVQDQGTRVQPRGRLVLVVLNTRVHCVTVTGEPRDNPVSGRGHLY